MKRLSRIFAVASVFMALGCSKKAADAVADAASDSGGGSSVDFSGNYQYCDIFSSAGSALNGRAYVRNMHLDANGGYTFSIYFSDSTSCATQINSGGQNIATYSQVGTYTLDGAATTPSGYEEVTFTVTSADLTVRPVYAEGAAFRDYLNASCSPSLSFTTGATQSSLSFAGITCTANSSYSFAVTPVASAILKNILSYDSGTSILAWGIRNNFWSPGATSSYPSAYGQDWKKY